jgi:leucyl aminopeptidase
MVPGIRGRQEFIDPIGWLVLSWRERNWGFFIVVEIRWASELPACFDLLVLPRSTDKKFFRYARQYRDIDFRQLVPGAEGMFESILARQNVAPDSSEFFYVPFNRESLKGVLSIPQVEKELTVATLAALRTLAARIMKSVAERHFSSVVIYAEDLLGDDLRMQTFIEAVFNAEYSFNVCRREKLVQNSENIIVSIVGGAQKSGSFAKGKAISAGIALARDIILRPPNYKRPVDLAEILRAKFQPYSQFISVDVVRRQQLVDIGAGGILGVGAAGEPVLVKIEYHPGKNTSGKRIALVGKGVTMDTGGYCLKPTSGQVEMKGDCGGAAAVAGTMLALALLRPNQHVVAYLPLVENLVDSTAYLTGCVLEMYNGTTVEVLNTDAEGRLILADALAMAVADGADVIVDLATLTGACVVALGTKYAALYSTCPSLAQRLITAGQFADERLWQMPLAKEYDGELKSAIADLKNIGGARSPGSIIAALFLQKFVGSCKEWAHLDIAGPSTSGIGKGEVSGFGVGTLVRFVGGYTES